MNIRTFKLALASILLLTIAVPMIAMDESLKKVAEHAAIVAGKEMERAGKEITKTLPTKIDLEFSPRSLWSSILSITGAVFIYNGFNQLLNTWQKTDATLAAKNEDRTKLYKIGACKIAAGFLYLGASYAVWNRK